MTFKSGSFSSYKSIFFNS